MCWCAKIINTILSVFMMCSLNVNLVKSFNIDAFNYAVYERSEKSMFGFTVAVHKQRSTSWVLVGAPEAQSIYQDQKVYKGGVVYKCRPDGDDVCEEIPFDRAGNQYIGHKELDQKSMQWFGATLATSRYREGGPVVACAPRYVWYSKEMNRRDPVGTCFVSDEFFEKFEEYSPCRTSNWGYHRQGSCQAGFSAAINSVGDRLFVGAPGSYYWQGQMYSIDAHAHFSYTPGLFGMSYGAKGSVHQQSLEKRPAVFQTREGKKEDDDSYLGYSTIIADFQGIGEEGVAVGMPRGADLHGKILLFTWNLTNYKNISGSQLGSYFGYSLAAADVDGDKKVDLIVGAPMHTEPNTEGKYDVGRVYVFYQGGGYGSFNKSSFLDGINSKSRFGHSLASLGDLNQDGYEDFAVGAPYDGPNNNGAVYIFYGSANGVLDTYGQVIYASDIQSRSGRSVSTFGFSLGGGLDMDGNDYPDLAVGAYLSDSVFFFRARPVVRVDAFVRFQTPKKQIDIQNKNCNIPNGQRGTCTTIDFCIKYGGKGIPPQIKLDVQYILDTKKPDVPRMAFMSRNSYTFNESLILYKDSSDFCKSEEIYIKNDIRDKLTALEAEVKYFMIQEDRSSGFYNKVRDPRSQLTPIIDLNSPPSRKDSIIIQKNCGSDNICIPNLHINVTKNVDKYLLGSHVNLKFYVIVSNFGEDSFETTFYLTFPEGIYYKKTEGALCSTRENNTITCDIGNPLQSNKIAAFTVIFVPYHKEEMSPSYDFDFFVNSTNPEDNSTSADNHKRVTIDIWVETKLDVDGKSIPQEIFLSNTSTYAEEIKRESDIGPQVTHLYTLRNKGPAAVNEAEIYFFWPWQTLGGEDLLYLLDQPHVPEGVKCDIPAPANYKNYELDYYTKSIWERLHIDSSSKYSDKYGEHSTVHVETGTNIPAIVGGTIAKGQSSVELDEKIKQSGGDASEILYERHNFNATSGQTTGGNTSLAGVTVYTKSEWTTVIENGKPVTKWTNVTTVKDASGKIINTYYSTDNVGNQKAQDSFGQKGVGVYQKSSIHPIYSTSGNVPRPESDSVDLKHDQAKSGIKTSVDEQSFRVEGKTTSTNEHESTNRRIQHGGSFYDETLIDRNDSGQHSMNAARRDKLKQEEERRRAEEERRAMLKLEEERKRIEEERRAAWRQEEERRRAEDERRAALKLEEERRRVEEEHRLRLKQEERTRYQITQKPIPVDQDTERRRYEEDRRRYEEEMKRQQQKSASNDQDAERRRYEEQRRRYEEELQRLERERYEERVRQEQIRRQEQEERRRYEQRRNTSRASTQSGYFDSEDNYSRPDKQRVFNRTFTVEGNAELDNINLGGQKVHHNFGSAASGNEFRTNAIELESLGGISGRHSDTSGRSSMVDFSTGDQGRWQSSGRRIQGGTISGTLEGGIESKNTYSQEYQNRHWADGSHSIPNYLDRDAPIDRSNTDSRSRVKRQIEPLDPDIDQIRKCETTNCVYMRCIVTSLKKDEFVSIALRSRLNVRAVKHLSGSQPVKLSSVMVARISKLPYIGKFKDQNPLMHEIFTDIPAKEPELPPKVVPLWIILLSAIAGTIILLLVILLLYKCGFFRRNRPSTTPERQPLNRNGYQTGDEAL